mmetsp:Transcript_8629/g.8594  ORF Transcript_8629/g.8594 Transcript_8629/m.8594 type:complete len:121 (+) Transcript_8629:10-372(+)
MEDDILDRLGNGQGLSKIVDDVFRRLLDDPRVKNRFRGRNIEQIKQGFTEYLQSLFTKNSNVYTGLQLSEVFAGLGITKHEVDVFFYHLEEAASDAAVSHTTIQTVLTTLSSLRSEVEGK